MNKVHVTEKGTKLPIMNLKGKDYMMVAYRIAWFRETHPYGVISTEALKITDSEAIFKAYISVPNAQGTLTLIATATKREDVNGFADFIEKAETGSIGRALALAGFGTQFSLPELDEGTRLADSPLESSKTELKVVPANSSETNAQTNTTARTSFRKPTSVTAAKPKSTTW
jgi:hypothetical protein